MSEKIKRKPYLIGDAKCVGIKMNKIKIIKIVSCISILLLLACLLSYYFIMIYYHNKIVDGSHNYKTISITSEDGKYLLRTIKSDEETGVYATFTIEEVNEQKIIFECTDKYRTVDLNLIKWDSLNVVVDSSDVGTIVYQFDDGTWSKK